MSTRLLPTLVAMLSGIVFLLPTSTSAQTFYGQDCISSTSNATLHVPPTGTLEIPTGASLQSPDTLAVYTKKGKCAGFGVWKKNGVTFAVAGTSPVNFEGFSNGESIELEVFDVSADTAFSLDSNVQYASCEDIDIPICRENGQYADGTFHRIVEISSSPQDTSASQEPVTQTLSLDEGKNLVSLRIAPSTSNKDAQKKRIDYDIQTIASKVDGLNKIKSIRQGDVYIPSSENDSSTTGQNMSWDRSKGYVLDVDTKQDVLITGDPITPTRSIDLKDGWNLIPFYPTSSMDPRSAFKEFGDIINVVQNDAGDLYYPALPDSPKNQLDKLSPGEAYMIEASQDTTFSYPDPSK